MSRAHLITAARPCQGLAYQRSLHPSDQAGAGARFTAWQATPSISDGASLRHRSKASGHRGLKAHPGGGSIGLGISPLTGIRWRPDIARSGTAPSNIFVYGIRGEAKSSRPSAISTMRPRYITPIRLA